MSEPSTWGAGVIVECEPHHWVSTNVPGLITRWVIQCSLCGAYNVKEMNAALSAVWGEGHGAGWNDCLLDLENGGAKMTRNPYETK